ncbi:MAG: RNA polymerase sigma factor [Rhizobacter sp.]|nr:RNA polymerase sigma factor [Ferruginibacter sp.]
MNQADLTAKIQNGDTSVFPDIVEQCQQMVYNTALSIVQNEADAEDITQEVFIEVYENLTEFRQEAQVNTWIYRITINKALDFEKRKKRQKHGGLLKRIFSVRAEEEPINFNHPGAQLDNKEKAAVLFRALKKLPENQQLAFTLHKIEGLPYKEVAAIMETSLYAVESLIARGKTSLKKILEDYYQSSE